MDELFSLLEKFGPRARVNAGGTDLLSLFKDDFLFTCPDVVINIKPIRELAYISREDGVLRIGALVSLSDLASSPLVPKLLREAALSVASPEIRNMGTVGGNLCQDVRCPYYRYPRRLGGPILCARKGDGPCLAVQGENRYHALKGKRCFAPCPSDLATALSALAANVLVVRAGRERKLPIDEFYHPFGTALEQGEIVKEVEVPFLKPTTKELFLKFTLRRPIDFAIVSVAARIEEKAGVIEDCSFSFGGISYRPERAREMEQYLKGKYVQEWVIEQASEVGVSGLAPLSQNGYKINILKALIKRSIRGENICGKI